MQDKSLTKTSSPEGNSPIADQRLKSGTPREVLIVDDSAILRLMLQRDVAEMGHHVTTAADGRQALELLQTKAFDLVLLDVIMPEMDGFAVLDAIKNDEALRDIPVVMISGLDDMSSVVRCIEHGAEDYLPKPYDAPLLRARVGACLEKKFLWDELNRNYHHLQELEKLRDSLTHMIVHDLRTPLTSFLTGLQSVEELGELNIDQRELLNISVEGGQMLLGMINDLLDISKMEAGSLKLALEDSTPRVLIEQAISQVNSLAEAKHLKLTAEVDSDLPALRIDEDKVRRSIVNLLGNAIKFTPSGGEVHLGATGEADGLHISVSDTGEGIPEEAFGRIFEKFGQAEAQQRSGRKMSTGLGLTFCKMVVEAHGGSIGVSSRLGEGSTFSLTLPVGAASAS